MMSVPVTRPVLDQAEVDAVAEVLRSGQLVQGAQVAEFERLVAERVGVAHAVAVTNCTAALHLALVALGVKPGDRVAVAPYSWVATANVIVQCGATPVFVDVDPATYNMDPACLEAVLDDAEHPIAAVLPVETFGNPAGFDQLEEVCARFGTPLVEDAACALGSHLDGRAAGSFGRVSCFSFHPRKIVTTGEGGMVVTDDGDVAAFARRHRNHGQELVDGTVQFVSAGGNLRITELQGAIGVVQMSRLDELVEARGRIARRYDDLITQLGFTPQRRASGAAVQSYVCTTPAGVAAQPIIERLRNDGIEATIGTNAIPFVRFYADREVTLDTDLPATAHLRDHALTLPLFPTMSVEQQDEVVAGLARAMR